jgi:CHASE3 domain sensor protein
MVCKTHHQPENQNNNMDFDKLSKFIFVLGIIVLVGGSIVWTNNKPRTFTPSDAKPGQNAFDAIAQSEHDSEARMQVLDDNMRAKESQKKATEVMIAGAIVIFIGVALNSSAKKKAP